jgi:2-pyrone-4,6-dicarboxylate lactonase
VQRAGPAAHERGKGHVDLLSSDGLLGDFIPHVAVTVELQRQMLISNPMRLYWPEETR